MDIRVDLSQFTAMQKRFAGAKPIVERELDAAMRAAGFVVEGQLKAAEPVGKLRGGNLRNSTGPPIVAHHGMAWDVTVPVHAEYAWWVDQGHGEIRPVRARVLVFETVDGWVFTKRVRPVAGVHFVDKAKTASEPGVNAVMSQAAARVAAALTGH